MLWTPYEIELILHHRASLAPFPRKDAPAYADTVSRLVEMGILTTGVDIKSGIFHVTPKGEALVEMWLNTPEPIQKFIDPRFG